MFIFFFNFFFNVYLFFGTERDRAWTGEGQRERGRHRIGNRLQALNHQPRARRGARTHRPRDRDLAEVGRSTDCATQAPPKYSFKQSEEAHVRFLNPPKWFEFKFGHPSFNPSEQLIPLGFQIIEVLLHRLKITEWRASKSGWRLPFFSLVIV